MKLFKTPFAFEWDAANRDKNFIKHKVTNEECEEVFFDPHKRLVGGKVHGGDEERHRLVGRTSQGRPLFVVFMMREEKIRVISARDLNRKERMFLE